MKQTTNRTVIVLIMMMLTTMTAWANDAVTYIDMDGQQQSVTEYTEVTSAMHRKQKSDAPQPDGGDKE